MTAKNPHEHVITTDFRPPDVRRLGILLLALRQALLIALGALEDYMGRPRTKPPNRR